MTNIDPDAIGSAPAEQPSGGSPQGTDPFTDPDLAAKRGLLGCIFGYGAHAKTMIVAFCLVLCFALIFWLIGLGANAETDEGRAFVSQAFTAVIGITGGFIGFLTGRNLS